MSTAVAVVLVRWGSGKEILWYQKKKCHGLHTSYSIHNDDLFVFIGNKKLIKIDDLLHSM